LLAGSDDLAFVGAWDEGVNLVDTTAVLANLRRVLLHLGGPAEERETVEATPLVGGAQERHAAGQGRAIGGT